MTPRILIEAAGHPRPLPRARYVGKRFVSMPKGTKAARWRATLCRAMRTIHGTDWTGHGPLAPDGMPRWIRFGAVELEMVFRFWTPRTERHGKPHLAIPDTDNLVKLVMDVMQEEGLVEDDRRVVKLIASKQWSSRGGVTLEVRSHGGGYPDSPDERTPPTGLPSPNEDLSAVPHRPPEWLAGELAAHESDEDVFRRWDRARAWARNRGEPTPPMPEAAKRWRGRNHNHHKWKRG